MGAKIRIAFCIVCVALAASAGLARAQAIEAKTPGELVAAYDSLADAILATKKTEGNLVHSILATTYRHAEAVYREAKTKLDGGKTATPEIETLAALVAQIGNEGDAAVAAIRKRLLEGGHHHHADAEEKGVYDEGYVVVTREAKKTFLDAAKKLGQMAKAPSASALDAEWQRVKAEFKRTCEGAKG